MAADNSKMSSDPFSQTFGIEWADGMGDPAEAPPMVIRLQDAVPSVVIGRTDAVDVCVMDPLMSRRHFEIRKSGDKWEACDLGSKNGTMLNGAVLGQEPQPVADGDLLEAGTSSFQVVMQRC